MISTRFLQIAAAASSAFTRWRTIGTATMLAAQSPARTSRDGLSALRPANDRATAKSVAIEQA
jgi:hypothetical protein